MASIKVVHKGFSPGNASVRRHLQIAENEDTLIYDFSRVIIKNGEPLAVNFSFVPRDIGKIVDMLDLTSAKVFPYLESAGYNLGYGEQEISSESCKEDVSALLDYEVGPADPRDPPYDLPREWLSPHVREDGLPGRPLPVQHPASAQALTRTGAPGRGTAPRVLY